MHAAVNEDPSDNRENCLMLTGATTSGKSWLLKPLGGRDGIYVAHPAPSKDCRFPLVGTRGEMAGGCGACCQQYTEKPSQPPAGARKGVPKIPSEASEAV